MTTVEHTYDHDVATVFAALSDPEHLRRRCESVGQKNVHVTVDTRGDVVEVRIARDIESDIPSFARKVVDPVNHVVDVITWRPDGEGKRGSYHVDVNKRISLDGTLSLRPTAGGCRYTDTFEAKVGIPLIGKKIAELVAKETVKGIEGDCRFTAKQLAG